MNRRNVPIAKPHFKALLLSVSIVCSFHMLAGVGGFVNVNSWPILPALPLFPEEIQECPPLQPQERLRYQ